MPAAAFCSGFFAGLLGLARPSRLCGRLPSGVPDDLLVSLGLAGCLAPARDAPAHPRAPRFAASQLRPMLVSTSSGVSLISLVIFTIHCHACSGSVISTIGW
jgi:hypothetical protein